jgi:hypothetical protein
MTKFAHLFSIPTDYKDIQVAEFFLREVFWLHGLPRKIVSDRDGRFNNAFWQEIFRLRVPATTHRQMDRQISSTNGWRGI